MTHEQLVDKAIKRRLAKIELAKRHFYFYCCAVAPDFYRPDRVYLKTLCDTLEDFIQSDKRVLIISLPPRFGKSRTATLFCQWLLGRNINNHIMTASYNEKLSTVFSKAVRDGISEVNADARKIAFSDVFPDIKIKYGDAASNLWSLEGSYNNYLSTSPTGTATGFGASIEIIDDLIKNDYEANNELILDGHWKWFTDTMLSRLEQSGKIIVIATRWASKDLSGRLIDYYKDTPDSVKTVCMKAKQDDGTMLCVDILSETDYEAKSKIIGKAIFLANYQQVCIDLENKLYSHFKTYNNIPVDAQGNSLFLRLMAYTDTADTGQDYLCQVIYGIYDGEIYIVDVYYTQAPMEITEKECAKRLYNYKVNDSMIESNNGGRGFARAVNQILQTDYHSNLCRIQTFTQRQNKQSRILTAEPWIVEHMYFPSNWGDRWMEYYIAMSQYQRTGKNKHDDAPDATTGAFEFARTTHLIK